MNECNEESMLKISVKGGSSVVSSAPTILQPRVQIPTTQSMLNCIIGIIIAMRSRTKINEKEAAIGTYF